MFVFAYEIHCSTIMFLQRQIKTCFSGVSTQRENGANHLTLGATALDTNILFFSQDEEKKNDLGVTESFLEHTGNHPSVKLSFHSKRLS